MLLMAGTPVGLQRADGDSLPWLSSLCINSALAHGWNGTSSCFRSAATLLKYAENRIFSTFWRNWFGSGSASQVPDKSIFPSAVFGAGAERSGLPSDVLGKELRGSFIHCGEAAETKNNTTTEARIELIATSRSRNVIIDFQQAGSDSKPQTIADRYSSASRLERFRWCSRPSSEILRQ